MSLKGKHIYMVEDNEDNIYVILSLLRQHGATVKVDWWASGEAKRVLEALPLDLIILDLMLVNGRSGYDVFKELRALPELKHVPILAVSAADPNAAIPKTSSLGFAGFIGKPIDFDLFPRQVEAVINGENVWYTD